MKNNKNNRSRNRILISPPEQNEGLWKLSTTNRYVHDQWPIFDLLAGTTFNELPPTFDGWTTNGPKEEKNFHGHV